MMTRDFEQHRDPWRWAIDQAKRDLPLLSEERALWRFRLRAFDNFCAEVASFKDAAAYGWLMALIATAVGIVSNLIWLGIWLSS